MSDINYPELLSTLECQYDAMVEYLCINPKDYPTFLGHMDIETQREYERTGIVSCVYGSEVLSSDKLSPEKLYFCIYTKNKPPIKRTPERIIQAILKGTELDGLFITAYNKITNTWEVTIHA